MGERKDMTRRASAKPEAFSSDLSYACFNDPGRRLVTGASLLFRNADMLDQVRYAAAPALMARGPRLHVWCAGCSTGMEAYSLAMVILDALGSKRKTTALRILGTDISQEALDTAAAGRYPVSENSIRAYKALVERYTERVDQHQIAMGPELRGVVVFKQRDIRVGSRRHVFELVVCDHVLQYFEKEVQREFLDSLARAVTPGGFLYVSSPNRDVLDALGTRYGFEQRARSFYRRPG